jgi:hypothetical protein
LNILKEAFTGFFLFYSKQGAHLSQTTKAADLPIAGFLFYPEDNDRKPA